MAISEAEAIRQVQQNKKKINRFVFNGIVEKLFFGVALTHEQMTYAAETIYYYFHNNNAGYLIKDIILKTMYRKEEDGTKTKIKSWLEYREGGILDHRDMYDLRFRISY